MFYQPWKDLLFFIEDGVPSMGLRWGQLFPETEQPQDIEKIGGFEHQTRKSPQIVSSNRSLDGPVNRLRGLYVQSHGAGGLASYFLEVGKGSHHRSFS